VRPWLLLWALGAALGLTACEQKGQAGVDPDVQEAPSEVLRDFLMNDVRNQIKQMSLRGAEARIYEAKHYADVDQPVLYFYKEGKESSRLNAPSGRLQTETHEVECWGGVTVVSADSSTLTTERLRYDPKVQKIFSDKPVHLDKPDSVTDGIGLETDPELKTVKIGRQKVRLRKRMQ
jgi:LPS export ABC transporter protein LptC